MEYFVPPAEAEQWFDYWVEGALSAGTSTSASPSEQLRLRPHDPDELSHYSAGTTDVEFLFPWGWGELEGIANRTDYDLKAHSTASGERLEYFDQAANERYTPYVIEPAAGATRAMMAFLLAAYDEDEVGGEARSVLRLDWRLAPNQVAVLPLSKKAELEPTAREVLAAPAAALPVRLRRDAVDRQALPAPGRGRDAVVRHGRLRQPRGPCGDRARPGHAPSRYESPSTGLLADLVGRSSSRSSRSPPRRACGTGARRVAPGSRGARCSKPAMSGRRCCCGRRLPPSATSPHSRTG